MTKLDMVAEITKKTGVEQTQVKRIVQMTLDGIIDVLVSEGRFELRDFGVFTVAKTPVRQGRNPRTGAIVMVPAGKRVRFSAGKHVAARVNGEEADSHP